MQVYIYTETSRFFVSSTNIGVSEKDELILSVLGVNVKLGCVELDTVKCLSLLSEVELHIKKLLPELEPLPKNISRKVKLTLFGQEYTFKPTTKVGGKLLTYNSLRKLLLDACDNNKNLIVEFLEEDVHPPKLVELKMKNMSKR